MSKSGGVFDGLIKVAAAVATGGAATPLLAAAQVASTVAQLTQGSSSGATPTATGQGQHSPNFNVGKDFGVNA